MTFLQQQKLYFFSQHFTKLQESFLPYLQPCCQTIFPQAFSAYHPDWCHENVNSAGSGFNTILLNFDQLILGGRGGAGQKPESGDFLLLPQNMVRGIRTKINGKNVENLSKQCVPLKKAKQLSVILIQFRQKRGSLSGESVQEVCQGGLSRESV